MQNPRFWLHSPLRLFSSVTYKSAISLENLFPGSSLKLTTPAKPPTTDKKFNGYIPLEDLQITYSKSSGPGGQNVNKVNTKVDVRFHLDSAKWISAEIKARLLEKNKTKLTNEGFLVFRSDLTRSQQLNLADCLDKIRKAVHNAAVVPQPAPETPEKIRRRLENAARLRLAEKRERSQVKADRQSPVVDL